MTLPTKINKLIFKIVKIIDRLRYSSTLKRKEDKIYEVSVKPIYISQFADADKGKIEEVYGKINDSKALLKFGAKSKDEFTKWAWRSCGVVCVEMIIKAKYPSISKKTMDHVNQVLNEKGYNFVGDVGWYHKSLLSFAKSYGFNGYLYKYASPEWMAMQVLKNNYVIVSVKGISSGHFILVYGVEILGSKIEALLLHDPNNFSTEGSSKLVKIDNFDKISTGRAILLRGDPS